MGYGCAGLVTLVGNGAACLVYPSQWVHFRYDRTDGMWLALLLRNVDDIECVFLDYNQYSGSNYPWDTPSRQPVREHGLQGILCADPFGSYEFRTRFEIGSLYQGPAKGDLPWYAHFCIGCNIHSLIFYTCSPNDWHSTGGVRSSRSEALDIQEHP